MIAIITAIISGALMSVQGVFNEGVTNRRLYGYPPHSSN